MIWRTSHRGLWRTVNPGLLFGAILVALVLVPWWAWGADSTPSPKRSATPAPTVVFPHSVRAKQVRHWHCWLGSACRTRECVESPLGCNGVPMAAWGTDPDLCPLSEMCVYYFCDGVSREVVAVPRHLCLAVGGDVPEWPLP